MVLASLLFAIMGAFVKEATQTVSSLQTVFFRSVIALVMVVPWMFYKKIPIIGKNKVLLFVRGASGFIALWLTFYVTSKIKLADAAILNRTAIFFVAILAGIFLKEKITKHLWLYTTLAFIGASLIIKPERDFINIPGILGVVAGFFAGVAYVAVKKLHDTESFFTIVFSFAFLGAFFSLLLGFNEFSWLTEWEIFCLLGLGITGTIAQLLMTKSYLYADASIISPFSFASVLFSFLFGLIFWGEVWNFTSFAGAFLLIVSGVLIMRLKQSDQTRNLNK